MQCPHCREFYYTGKHQCRMPREEETPSILEQAVLNPLDFLPTETIDIPEPAPAPEPDITFEPEGGDFGGGGASSDW